MSGANSTTLQKVWRTVVGGVLGLASISVVGQTIDCPLRDTPYSADSPLLDVLMKPEATAVLDREAPTLLRGLPAFFKQTTVPTFSAIMSVRTAAAYMRLPEEAVDRLNRTLASVAVTDQDRQARCARYDVEKVAIDIPQGAPRLLLFEKMTGFRDGPSVNAAGAAFRAMAARKGWAIVATDKAGAITPAVLKRFDAVIWNNISGDVLTLRQRRAFSAYIERGGGFVGIHGSAGDPVYFWDWYVDELIGARFIGHPSNPQFQQARIIVEDPTGGITRGLGQDWSMTDEWYSFRDSPRLRGAHVLATLDEASYKPESLAMGDHPIAWTRCVGNGRSFYSAIGHRPQTYVDATYVTMLENAVEWAAGRGASRCRAGKELSADR